MLIVLTSAILMAVAITGVITALFSMTSTPPREFNLIHWAGAFLCVAISSCFIAGAIGFGKASRQLEKSADAATALSSGALNTLRGHTSEEISALLTESNDSVASKIESVRTLLKRKFHKAVVLAVVVTVVLNLLYLLLLSSAGRKPRHTSGSDGFDDFDSDCSNLGNFDSSLDDDFI